MFFTKDVNEVREAPQKKLGIEKFLVEEYPELLDEILKSGDYTPDEIKQLKEASKKGQKK